MQCAAPAWLASGTKMGHAGLGGVPACFAHHANAGRFASQSLACIRLLQNRAKLTPFVIDAPSFAGRKGIRVIRPKPQSIDILIFSVCLRGGPGVAIRSSCYRQKRHSRHTRQILSPAPNPFGRGRQSRDRRGHRRHACRRRRRNAYRQSFRRRCGGPNHARRFHTQRSLLRQWGVGNSRNPRLSEEARLMRTVDSRL
jgi:hypothetical protein